MRKLLKYLNPIAQLGNRRYSLVLPTLTVIISCILLELLVHFMVLDQSSAGIYAIFISLVLVLYFSFHDGIIGGIIASALIILYYFYIMFTRRYMGSQLVAGIQTTVLLGLIYGFMSVIIGWLKQTIDILIEREADERQRLQTIIQQLPVGVLITDHSGRVLVTNRQADTIMGIKIPLGYVVGTDALVTSGKGRTPTSAAKFPLMQALGSGRAIVGKEYLLDRTDGKKRHVQISASAIHNKEGKVIAAASIINDITQQKELEKRKDDFVNMASHELKTPITSMKLYIDTLSLRLAKSADEKSVKIIRNIKNQTDKLQQIVNDLLDVSRLQTGKLTFTKEQFRLDHLLKETVDVLQQSAMKQQLVLTKTVPTKVTADKFRIYQVVTNLITNAIKYSGETTPINISLSRNSQFAVVSVQDFGIGIAKDQQRKIFERLYQVTDDTGKTFPGFGMGLYIAQQIITSHKGKIWVESSKGKGSTFYFSLPIQPKPSTIIHDGKSKTKKNPRRRR